MSLFGGVRGDPEGRWPLLVLVLVLLVAYCCIRVCSSSRLMGGGRRWRVFGGAPDPPPEAKKPRRITPRVRQAMESANVVVDTLNLTHVLLEEKQVGAPAPPTDGQSAAKRKQTPKITRCSIAAAIEHAAPILRKKFSGRVIFVLKDRDSSPDGVSPADKAFYKEIAHRLRVGIHIAEKVRVEIPEWQEVGSPDESLHQKRGRDDFYLGLLAWRFRCGVLTDDRMRDFDQLKTEVRPFRVHIIEPWGMTDAIRTDQVFAGAQEYSRILSPVRLRYEDNNLRANQN